MNDDKRTLNLPRAVAFELELEPDVAALFLPEPDQKPPHVDLYYTPPGGPRHLLSYTDPAIEAAGGIQIVDWPKDLHESSDFIVTLHADRMGITIERAPK